RHGDGLLCALDQGRVHARLCAHLAARSRGRRSEHSARDARGTTGDRAQQQQRLRRRQRLSGSEGCCLSALPDRLGQTCRTAFITGASAGLGEAFTRMLLDEGVAVWGTARSLERLNAFSATPSFHPVALDLHDAEATERL